MTVAYSTTNGTAVAGTDYTATSGTLSFGSTDYKLTFSVPIARLYDPTSKSLTVKLSDPTPNGVLSLDTPNTATLTIAGSSVLPTLTVASVMQAEGNSGTTSFDFAAHLSKPSVLPVTVTYTTSDGTALAGVQYEATKGTLTIPAGQTDGTISVPVNADTAHDVDKTFNLNITNVTGAMLQDFLAQGTIENDDPLPDISVENAAGSAPSMTFNVKLSTASMLPVTVNYKTTDGTAIAGKDYTAVRDAITILPGETVGTITVPLIPAAIHEADKTLEVKLSNATGVTIKNSHATGTVQCSVAEPQLSIQDASDMGRFLAFKVQLSSGTSVPVTVNYSTVDDTAHAGQDYTAVSESLVIPPGQRLTTIVVPIVTRPSQQRQFFIKTSGVTNAAALTEEATGVIKPANAQAGDSSIIPTSNIVSLRGRGWLGHPVLLHGIDAAQVRPEFDDRSPPSSWLIQDGYVPWHATLKNLKVVTTLKNTDQPAGTMPVGQVANHRAHPHEDLVR